MEYLYNPDQMSEREIKETFVARGPLVDRLVDLIRHQPEGAGVQHVVLVAPRGMGKTTLLLMVQFAVADRGLSPAWLAIRFPEELYGVTDLAEFWLETLENVSHITQDTELAQKTQTLKDRYPDSEQLQEATLALLRDWCRRHKRRLLLLVDNFHLVLSQINDEQQNAALRNVLMNEGFLMILGAAPSFFKEASAYDEPLYNFFQIERLERLRFEEMLALLRQRAAADGLTDFERTLDANRTRLKVLEYFTGGNARLALMLYRVISRSNVSEVRQGLELLLDQVTPYYKDKTEALPPQQRKILDAIARRSGQTHEGISPSEIARAVRLSPQLVSAQLKRLSDAGYVEPANLRGRTASYTLSEPLYSLWYQMRFGRDARQRMMWLVEFLKGFYTAEELTAESRLLESRFHELQAAGFVKEASGALEYRRWIAEAMPDRSLSTAVMESVIQGYLTLKDTDTLKEQVLSCYQLENLSPETLAQLVKAECITSEEAKQVGLARATPETIQKDAEFQATLLLAVEAIQQQQFEQSLQHFDRVLELGPQTAEIWHGRGYILKLLKRHEEALTAFDRALELDPMRADTWNERSIILGLLGHNEEALANSDHALELDPQAAKAWKGQGMALSRLGRYEEAVTAYEKELELDPSDADVWFLRGLALYQQNKSEMLASFDHALTVVSPENSVLRMLILLWRFMVYMALGRKVLAWQDWQAAAELGAQNTEWSIFAPELLLAVAQSEHIVFVPELIRASPDPERFFPLARALDYLETGDAALIEKLTPEMRPIVEAVVAQLRPVAVQGQATNGKTARKQSSARKRK